jgi:hypothetical protein
MRDNNPKVSKKQKHVYNMQSFIYSPQSQNKLWQTNEIYLQNNPSQFHVKPYMHDIMDTTYLWHLQLGHNNKIKLKDIQNVCKLGIDPFNASKISLCKCCLKDNQHRSKIPKVGAIQEGCIHTWINH